MFRRITPNPELELLREEAIIAEGLSQVSLSSLKNNAKKVHSAFLFEIGAKTLLQNICLFLSSTASGKSYGDWQKFAYHLSLSNEQIQCIEYDFKGLQDPTYYVILAFVQSKDATFDKLLIALEKIGRLDIISRINDLFNDYFQKLVEMKCCEFKQLGFYLPTAIPKAPLVLNPVNLPDNSNNVTKLYHSLKDPQGTTQKFSKKYGSVVMLTFAENDRIIAKGIAKVLRSKEPKIGVIILQEQEKLVFSQAETFIEDCFKQVNYVIPVLTENYLNRINSQNLASDETSSLDSKYLRYIYSLLKYEYVKQDCVNTRVRCIVPDDQVNKIMSMDLHPILQAWFRESDINLFSKRVLLQSF